MTPGDKLQLWLGGVMATLVGGSISAATTWFAEERQHGRRMQELQTQHERDARGRFDERRRELLFGFMEARDHGERALLLQLAAHVPPYGVEFEAEWQTLLNNLSGTLAQAFREIEEKGGTGEAELAAATRAQIAATDAVRARTDQTLDSRSRARALWKEGYELYEKDEPAQAEKKYLASIQADPTYAPPYNSLGRIALDRNRPEEAEQRLQQAIARRKTYSPAWNNLGILQWQKGETDEAVESFERAIRINPDDAHAKTNLARLKSELRARNTP